MLIKQHKGLPVTASSTEYRIIGGGLAAVGAKRSGGEEKKERKDTK